MTTDVSERDEVVGEPEGVDPSPVPWSRRLQVWRSPADQPAWARPALLVVTALAAFSYSWRVGSTVQIYYGAAVRSMAQSWHNFFYGAFDPAGTVTVDKLPGALWVQALFVRLFGFNVWSLILPQAIEGALTVLVLYRVVRRLGGPASGILAAVVLAASPATVTLDRGNVPDTLMILLLVLAADSTVTAIRTGRWRPIVLAGVWVALAFQAKMLEAWLVLPALGLAYLLAGRGTLGARVGRVAVIGVTAGVLSLSYITFFTLTPASHRPYADGSTNNSIYHQVFSYNGFSRVGNASPNEEVEHSLATRIYGASQPAPKVTRLLTSYYGRDTGWLLPTAVVALAGILVARWRAPRTDLLRTGAVLWGAWLAVLGFSFTFSTTMNSYYSGALSPAVAALLGMGGALAWRHRHVPAVMLVSAATVLVTAAYAARLLPGSGTGEPSGLKAAVVVLGLAGAGVLTWVAWRIQQGRTTPGTVDLASVGAVVGAVAIVLVPLVASASVVVKRLGPFDTPFEPTFNAATDFRVFAPPTDPPGLSTLEATRRGTSWLAAAQTSSVAGQYIFATGDEVVPLGGYTGTTPWPSTSATAAMVARGDFSAAVVATPRSPGAAYIVGHCSKGLPVSRGFVESPSLRLYSCGAATDH